MNKRGMLIDVIQKAQGLENSEKLRLILFALGLKPSTYVRFKVLKPEELLHFEKHVAECGFVFARSRAKGYEEITKIVRNKVVWRVKGIWYGYDVFKDERTQRLFQKYKKEVGRQNHYQADKLGAQLYGYPACCMRKHTRLQNLKQLVKEHSYKSFFQQIHALDRKFPFVQHVPCSVSCRKTAALNTKYRAAIKKHAPKFYKAFTKKTVIKTAVLIDTEADILHKGKSVWGAHTAHEYRCIALKPIQGKYYMFSDLTSKKYERGSVVASTIILQYHAAQVSLGKLKNVLKNVHHERKFLLPERRY